MAAMACELPALPPELQAPLDACLGELPAGAGVAVAVSGGPDSVALALAAARAARLQARPLYLLHIHHGLMAQADAWADGVHALGQRLGVPVKVRRVCVQVTGQGLEEAARAARYVALAEMARDAGVAAVLLAHHQDDQAETILMRLLRGAGIAGVAGMRACLERDGMRYLRCWLDVPRARILACIQLLAPQLGLRLADDPSNQDPHYARGHLRARVLPMLAEHWPGYRATLTRFGRLAREAESVLAEVAAEDLRRITRRLPAPVPALVVSAWRALAPARRRQALRAWLAQCGLAMPAERRLEALMQQMLQARMDRQVQLEHDGITLRIYRDLLLCAGPGPRLVPAPVATPATFELRWQGESEVPVPAFGGRLCFETAACGIPAAWLRDAVLRVGMRRGRERLRLHPERPSRSLKNLYQEQGVPAWERDRLPLVWRGEQLIHVAGLGTDVRVPQQPGGIRLVWLADAPGASLGVAHDKGGKNAG